MDADDVGMAQPVDGARLAAEARGQSRVGGDLGPEHLDRLVAADVDVLDQVDLPGRALTDQPDHPVRSVEDLPDHLRG